MATKIAPELNRERVRKSQEKADRFDLYLPKGTKERINKLGFKPNAFARGLVLEELDKLERMAEKR